MPFVPNSADKATPPLMRKRKRRTVRMSKRKIARLMWLAFRVLAALATILKTILMLAKS